MTDPATPEKKNPMCMQEWHGANDRSSFIPVEGSPEAPTLIAELEQEIRETAQRGEHAHILTLLGWADRLATLKGQP
jgi:hypothetical protein